MCGNKLKMWFYKTVITNETWDGSLPYLGIALASLINRFSFRANSRDSIQCLRYWAELSKSVFVRFPLECTYVTTSPSCDNVGDAPLSVQMAEVASNLLYCVNPYLP